MGEGGSYIAILFVAWPHTKVKLSVSSRDFFIRIDFGICIFSVYSPLKIVKNIVSFLTVKCALYGFFVVIRRPYSPFLPKAMCQK